jgi:predicted DNA-binding protein (MmcQ/YjbR family)
MTHKEIEEYILSMPNARLDYPFGKDVAVYKVDDKMFALIAEKSDPLSISLKCDPQLAKLLREKYETIMEGYHLNKKHWNTMLLTGQVPLDEVHDLIRHSYELVIA